MVQNKATFVNPNNALNFVNENVFNLSFIVNNIFNDQL